MYEDLAKNIGTNSLDHILQLYSVPVFQKQEDRETASVTLVISQL